MSEHDLVELLRAPPVDHIVDRPTGQVRRRERRERRERDRRRGGARAQAVRPQELGHAPDADQPRAHARSSRRLRPLGAHELAISPAAGDQLGMRAALHDPSSVEHDDLVRERERRDPVGDEDHRDLVAV